MAKKQKMDFSKDRLHSIASTLLDEHNYIGALKMLNRNTAGGDDDSETYMLYAEAYDDMGLLEKCVNKWFAYIDNAFLEEDALGDAYEGLAMAYMNMGRAEVSAFYYNKILNQAGDVADEERKELLKAFLGDDKNPLKIVSPPEKADYSDNLSEAIDKIRDCDYAAAAELLEEVPDVNPDYITAHNYLAMCYVITERYEEAERECLNILKKDPDNIQAMISYSAVKNETGDREASIACTRKLLAVKTDNYDDIYKIATVCCENDMHEEAYETFSKLDNQMQYDFNLLYFKAIAAYNCGKKDKAKETIKDLITIYPSAYTARRTLEHMNNGAEPPLSYFYRIPAEEREQKVKLLVDFDKCTKTQLKTFNLWNELRDAINWCLDEADNRPDADMLRAAASCAIKAGFDDIVRELLLNAFIADNTKIGMLRKLCERNEDNNFGVVICNIYCSVDIYAVEIGRTKRKLFVSAYADLVCRFALINNDYSMTLAEACEQLYDKLESRGKLNLCTDDATVAAAIFSSSDLKVGEVFNGTVCNFFGADEAKYNKIMEDIQ